MEWEGHTFHLIDTPGFDDTKRCDTETFEEIAFWLTVAHDHEISISGLIYLHRITDLRIQRAALQSLEIFKKMCGAENYNVIVLGTTRWDEVLPNQRAKAKARQQQLCGKDQFWGDVIQAGGKVVALDNSREDALRILAHIANKNRKITLAFQRQVFKDDLQIFQTDAGRVLYAAVNKQLKESEAGLEEATKSIREEIIRNDRGRAGKRLAELREQRDAWMREIGELEEGIDALQEKWMTKMESKMAKEQQELEKLMNCTCVSNTSERTTSIRQGNTETDTMSLSKAQRVRRSVPVIMEPNARHARMYLTKREIPSRKLTALTVAGTALGGLQLLAAVSCTVQ